MQGVIVGAGGAGLPVGEPSALIGASGQDMLPGADYGPVLAHIESYWPKIIRRTPRQRGTLIGLPFPYLVPSDGAMFQEMYYWDSYFIAQGLGGDAQRAPRTRSC